VYSAFRLPEPIKPTPFANRRKVPCLIDGETVVWDSLAITEYLAERSPAVWPFDVTARTWARCAVAEMHSGFQVLRECCTMNCGLRIQIASPSPALAKDLTRLNALWLEGLTRFGGPYLAGPAFTAVDAFFAPVAFRIQTYGLVWHRLLAHTSTICWRCRPCVTGMPQHSARHGAMKHMSRWPETPELGWTIFAPLVSRVGRISFSVMRRNIYDQHAAQYGYAY